MSIKKCFDNYIRESNLEVLYQVENCSQANLLDTSLQFDGRDVYIDSR